LIEHLPSDLVLLPAQTLGELFRVLKNKAKRSADETRDAISIDIIEYELLCAA